MSRTDDIYSKSQLPVFTRRHTQFPGGKGHRISASNGGNHGRPHVQVGADGVPLPSRRKRHVTHRNMMARRVGIGFLFILFLIYVGLLVRSFYGGKDDPSSVHNTTANAQVGAARTGDGVESGTILEQLAALREGAKSGERQLAAIYALMDDGAWDKAQEQMNLVRDTMPDTAPVCRIQAEIHIGRKEYKPAVHELIAVLTRTPDDWDAKQALAGTLLAMKENDAALLVSEWMLEEQPYSVEARHMAASAELNLNMVTQAVLQLKKILEIDSENRDAQQMLSVAYRKQGDYDKAIKLLTEQLAVDDRDSVVYYNLAVCYASMNNSLLSLDWLRKASAKFGHSFVSSWINGAEFDTMKTNEDFVAFFALRNEVKHAE